MIFAIFAESLNQYGRRATKRCGGTVLMEPDKSPELPEDQLPQEVAAELKRRYAVQNGVPQSVDSAVLADAERHLNSVFRAPASPNSGRRFAWVAASAGSLLAVVLLVLLTPW